MEKMAVVKTYDIAKFHPSQCLVFKNLPCGVAFLNNTHTPFIPWDAIKNVQCVPIIYQSYMRAI